MRILRLQTKEIFVNNNHLTGEKDYYKVMDVDPSKQYQVLTEDLDWVSNTLPHRVDVPLFPLPPETELEDLPVDKNVTLFISKCIEKGFLFGIMLEEK